MITSEKKKSIQFILGGLIVAGAFLIMLPGFVTYLFSLWRIISLIATVLIVAWLIVFIYHKLVRKNKDAESTNEQ